MSGLPSISGREWLKALQKVGFYLKRQEGSHMVLRRDDPFAQVVVPTTKNSTAAPCARLFGSLVSV